jgi:hypothetical protein
MSTYLSRNDPGPMMSLVDMVAQPLANHGSPDTPRWTREGREIVKRDTAVFARADHLIEVAGFALALPRGRRRLR